MTELIWEGKYKDGKKVTPVRIALPFQTIETVNESAQQRQKTLDFFASEPAVDFNKKEWRNRLIWGDKKYVLPSLLPEFAGKVNLIYIDPPFNVGSDFSFIATISDSPDAEEDETTSFVKQPSIIEQKAYRDTWGKGLDSYMQWFYETALLLKELLAEDGSIYVHLDWHVGHYAKVILDEVFGYDNFESQIVWERVTTHSDTKGFGFNHDIILFYSKSDKFNFNKQYVPLSDSYIKSHYTQVDKEGRRFRWDNSTAAGQGPARIFFGKKLEPPKGTHWRWSQENIDKLTSEGRIELTSKGMPQYKRFLDEMKGKVLQSVWADIFPVNSQAQERLDYDTQKPESLLERVINASSNEGDLILDCFCGSGTTAAVAEKLNRRWITCDLGRFSIHTARKRFLGIDSVKPFIVQNLGKYERQQWVNAEFENPEDRIKQEKAYRTFILDLYHAKLIDGYTWLHGAKAGKMIHVGSVEAPVTVDDIKATIKEFWKVVGKEKAVEKNHIDFLGWDFAFDVNETAKQFAAENNVQIHPVKIPREVLEQKAVDQGDIKFYELASLGVKTKINKLTASVTLDNFIIPPDDVPQEVQGKITHWSQWIDYWAVDWNYRDDTFHNEWQSYRTKQHPKIELTAGHTYEKKGKYTVLVKVIDILGNDTTKSIEITV
ncbi:MAG: Type III restriction-modification system methylation subunit [Cytophagales bacterium]|jgi:adenine specific DNA methylase Mod|nr:MAG: Type III restriction-modification system methylation subunit [Cytophagales bacterium]